MFDDDLFIEEALEADVLLAGGGGSGGSAVSGSTGRGGGGGAGRLFIGLLRLVQGAYPIVVGVAGAARPIGGVDGLDGGATSGFGITMPGGGGGGAPPGGGRPGGSGGGGGSTDGGTTSGGAAMAGTGQAGQGSAGKGGAVSQGGAGGGAAGNPADVGSIEGSGVPSAISGATVIYCQGATNSFTGGGTPGCGGRGGVAAASGAGQNGIAIISYPGPPRAAGGTITTAAGRTIHTFTANGTFTVLG